MNIINYEFVYFFDRFNYIPQNLKFKYARFKTVFVFKYLYGMLLKKGKGLTLLHLLLNFFSILYVYYLKQEASKHLSSGTNLSSLNPGPGVTTLVNDNKALLGQSFINYEFNQYIGLFFHKFRFLFSFFLSKVNKLVYKYSRYKIPKYTLYVYYLPKYKRFKNLLSFFIKTIKFNKVKSFNRKLFLHLFAFINNPMGMFFINYIRNLQKFVLSKYKKTLLIGTSSPQKFQTMAKKEILND